MKRNKKPDKVAFGQLCLFETPPLRQQEEENRTKPQKKPVEASNPSAPTFIPPAPVEAVKQPENALKTKIPDREELRRLGESKSRSAAHAKSDGKEKSGCSHTRAPSGAVFPSARCFCFSCETPARRAVVVKEYPQGENVPLRLPP